MFVVIYKLNRYKWDSNKDTLVYIAFGTAIMYPVVHGLQVFQIVLVCQVTVCSDQCQSTKPSIICMWSVSAICITSDSIHHLHAGDILKKHGIQFHVYADDCQSCTTFEVSHLNRIAVNMEILIYNAYICKKHTYTCNVKHELPIITSSTFPFSNTSSTFPFSNRSLKYF